MVSCIGAEAANMHQLMAEVMQKMNAADTDGVKGLSKDELSSITSVSGSGGNSFIESLNQRFEEIDGDANGQLTFDEIAKSKISEEPMGPPPGLDIDSEQAEELDKTLVGKTEQTSSETSKENMLDKIIQALVDAFTDSYKKQDSKEQAPSVSELTKSADANNDKGLSLDELSSVDTPKNPKTASVINDLIKNFGSYDLDGDGILSSSELQNAMPKQFSKQEIAAMAKEKTSEGLNAFGSFLGNTSTKFVQQLVQNYDKLSALSSVIT